MDGKEALLLLYCIADLAAGIFASFVLVSSLLAVRTSSLPLPVRAIRLGIEWRNPNRDEAHVSVPGPKTPYTLWIWRLLSLLVILAVMGLLLRNLVDPQAEALLGSAVHFGTVAVLVLLLLWVSYLLYAFRIAKVS